MSNFECDKCGYRWKPKGDMNPKRCPYCSSDRIAPARQAQEILDDL